MSPFPRPLILGHRGSPLEATENTLESLGRALLAGADGVELDVQRSSDGVPVVIHDDSLERLWGSQRLVSKLTWPAIERLHAARIPSFEQAAGWAAASGAWLNVELKAAGVEREVLALIDHFGILERTFISSFDAEIVRDVGEVDDGILRFFLTESWDARAMAMFERSGASGICLGNEMATDENLDDLRQRDLPVVVWTVNDAARVRALLEAGVAGVISDRPAMAAAERNRFTGPEGA